MSDDAEAKAGWDALKEIAGKLQAKNAGIQLTDEDRQIEAEHQRKLDEFHAKYPGNDGSETARLAADGSLQVHYSARGDGLNSHGDVNYKPDDSEFAALWKRHKMDEANGRSHFIMKKWDAENKVWIDLGDGWS